MEFTTDLRLSWKIEKSPGSARLRQRDDARTSQLGGAAKTRSLISTETILRPALSISMCTARSAATPWMPRQKLFGGFASFTRGAARHRFCSRQRQRLSTKSLKSCKPFAILDQASARLLVFMLKDPSFRRRKPERNAPSSFRIRHRL